MRREGAHNLCIDLPAFQFLVRPITPSPRGRPLPESLPCRLTPLLFLADHFLILSLSFLLLLTTLLWLLLRSLSSCPRLRARRCQQNPSFDAASQMDNRRKKPVITGFASSDGRKEQQSSTPVTDKRKEAPSKSGSTSSLTTPPACKRLSSDFHRKCCANENESEHDPKSCRGVSDRKGRESESPSPGPSGDRALGRRSQSVPRTALRPIVTTLSTIKRMEYNLERARDAANFSPLVSKSTYTSPYSMSSRRTPVSSVPAATSRTPTTPTVFSAIKTPVRSTAKIAKCVMSGTKPKTTPVPTTRSLAIHSNPGSSSALTDAQMATPSDERKAISSSKQTSAVSYAANRMTAKTQSGSKELVSSRAISETDHVTVTQSGGKGNVNIKMRISMAIKKDGEHAAMADEKAETRSRRSSSPRTRAHALLNYTPAAVKEYAVEKTTVAVAVRLRPFSTRELKNPEISRVVYLDREKKCVNVNKHEFEFNHVLDSFDPDPIDDQEQVYDVVGKPLLDHCLEGYNACLFAYGQTGSGKTYSLTGEEDVLYFERQGVIPRLIKDLFLEMQLDSIVTMTYIEIYNDQIFNLLNDATSDLQQLTYKIRESTVYGPYIPNLAPIVVESADDLLSRWSMGNIKRQKAATACNDHSSRSHAILQITVQQKYQDTSADNRDTDADSQVSDGDRLVSKINLVDLAGSERVAQAQTTGERFKEGTAINKSLLTLGKVISELSTMHEHRNKVHIPYRESALTFLLKESLGGNSRTCMLATISPANTQIEETLSTLRYASKAQRIVNSVRINEDPKILRIRQLEQEIHRLQRMLEQKGLTTKSQPSSPSTTDSSALTSSPSAAQLNSSLESLALASESPAPSDYTTPMKTPKKVTASKDNKQQNAAPDKSDHGKKSEKKAEKTEAKVEKDKSEKAVDKKKEKQNEKKKADEKSSEKSVNDWGEQSASPEAKETTKTSEKAMHKESKQKESKPAASNASNQSIDSTASVTGAKDSDRKGQKKKQSAPEPETSAVSPAKKEKKEKEAADKSTKKTKDSAVNTDSSAAKKKKKLEVAPPAPSKLLHQIEEIFSTTLSDVTQQSQDTNDLTNLTYVSAGDASSLLNQAIVDNDASGASDSTVREASRHVNFRDTISVRSYQVSMNSTAADVSAASTTVVEKKDKSSKKKKEKKAESPKPAAASEAKSDCGSSERSREAASGSGVSESAKTESSDWGAATTSDWGTSAAKPTESSDWGATSEPADGAWGGESSSAGGWGSSDATANDQKEEESKASSSTAQTTDWGTSSEQADGWGASTDSWGGATTAEEDSSVNWENLHVGDDSATDPLSWSTCLKDNGVGGDDTQKAAAADDDWN